MINLDELLKYQTVDINLRKVLDEIDKSDFGKKMDAYKKEFNNAKQLVTDSEKSAEELALFFNNSMKYCEDNSKRLEELESKLAVSEDMEERKELVRQLEAIKNKFADLDKKLSERKARADKAVKEYVEGQSKGKFMRDKYNESKESLDKFRKSKEPIISGLKAELDAIRPKVDAKLMELYKSLTADRKYPALVPANSDGRQYSCGGCGLTLSQKTQSEMIDKGICVCDTCRRMIYLPDSKKK